MGHITHEIIEKFRVGSYEEADPIVKKAWLFCIMEILPCINSLWKRNGVQMRANLLSEATANQQTTTSVSDEAVIAWYFKSYMEQQWIAQIAEDTDKENGGEPKKKKGKTKGLEHASKSNFKYYFMMKGRINRARKDPSEEAKSWEHAVKHEAQQQFETEMVDKTIDKASKKKNAEQTGEELLEELLPQGETEFMMDDLAVLEM